MFYQTTNYLTAPTFPNPYITRRLNNMNKVEIIKEERNNRTRIYHKTLKRLEVIIDVQKQVKDMMKIAEEANMTITEIEASILKASTNNQAINTTNIIEVSKDLRYLVQSDIEN